VSDLKNPEVAFIKDPNSILVYPPSGKGAIEITAGDYRRLEPEEYFNDTLIEFGMKFVSS